MAARLGTMLPPPKALIFDVFGTLVDWRSSIAESAAQRFKAAGVSADTEAFADAWRGEYQPAMERIRSGNRGYIPLDDLHRENLELVLTRLNLADAFQDLTDWARDWENLDPWPDVVAGLTAAKSHALIAPCSNGSIALMSHMARRNHFPWDAILGADVAQNYKPHPSVYHAAVTAFRLTPGEVMMVAAHEDDLAAAEIAGLQTGFIPRPKEFGPDNPPKVSDGSKWTATAPDLPSLVEIVFAGRT